MVGGSWRLSEARFPLSSFPTRKAASVFDFGDPCAAIDLDAGLGDSEIGRLKGG